MNPSQLLIAAPPSGRVAARFGADPLPATVGALAFTVTPERISHRVSPESAHSAAAHSEARQASQALSLERM